jgi:dolichol-phosphate mannosyltransferase
MNPQLSVVIPVCDEAENVEPLARETAAALRGRCTFEIVFVDDGSRDATAQAAVRARANGIAELRLLRHSFRAGQSAAITTGVRAARAEWIGVLDGDGQNDPADLPRMLELRDQFAASGVRLIMGNRTRRNDTAFRRFQSRIANGVRRVLLADGTPDTGCGIKVMHRETFLELPNFDHMHRFLPALYQRAGSDVISVPVHHRPRARGRSKYGMFDRLWVGIVDLLGVMWLKRRSKPRLSVREE